MSKSFKTLILSEEEEKNLLNLLNDKSDWLYSTLVSKHIKITINDEIALEGKIDVEGKNQCQK